MKCECQMLNVSSPVWIERVCKNTYSKYKVIDPNPFSDNINDGDITLRTTCYCNYSDLLY